MCAFFKEMMVYSVHIFQIQTKKRHVGQEYKARLRTARKEVTDDSDEPITIYGISRNLVL